MIREDGKIVIHRRFNYRLKTVVLRDEEIEEIYNYQLARINKEKRLIYEKKLLEMFGIEYSKEFAKKLEQEEKEKIEQLIETCIENQNAIDSIGIGYVWDLNDNYIYHIDFNKKYEEYAKNNKILEEICLKYN